MMEEDVSDALAWVHNDPGNNSIFGLHAHKHAYAHKHNMIDTDKDKENTDTDKENTDTDTDTDTEIHDDVSKRNGNGQSNGNGNCNVNRDGSKKKTKLRPCPLFFGGYSSGSHIAASLLQRPDLLASCDGVVMVSGLLAVRSSPIVS